MAISQSRQERDALAADERDIAEVQDKPRARVQGVLAYPLELDNPRTDDLPLEVQLETVSAIRPALDP